MAKRTDLNIKVVVSSVAAQEVASSGESGGMRKMVQYGGSSKVMGQRAEETYLVPMIPIGAELLSKMTMKSWW